MEANAPGDRPMPADQPSSADQVVARAWQDQALWSAVANELRDGIQQWRKIAAVAGIAGLFFTVLASTLSNPALESMRNIVATLGVLLLAVVPFVRQSQLTPERLRAWTRARNVSELLKEAIFRHLMGVLSLEPPTDGSPVFDPTHPGALSRRSRAIQQAAIELSGLAAAVKVPERKSGPPKTRLTVADYVADRVQGQVRYYKNAAETAGLKAKKLHRAEFWLGIAAVLLGTLSGLQPPPADTTQGLVVLAALAPWVAVVVAAGIAVTAHLAATRYDDLAT